MLDESAGHGVGVGLVVAEAPMPVNRPTASPAVASGRAATLTKRRKAVTSKWIPPPLNGSAPPTPDCLSSGKCLLLSKAERIGRGRGYAPPQLGADGSPAPEGDDLLRTPWGDGRRAGPRRPLHRGHRARTRPSGGRAERQPGGHRRLLDGVRDGARDRGGEAPHSPGVGRGGGGRAAARIRPRRTGHRTRPEAAPGDG